MPDMFSLDKRSWIMARIHSGNTAPEKKVRAFLHTRGFRFRLHSKNLPGKPDIILARFKTVIFVHGCFWHQCPRCKGGRLTKSNLGYWEEKLKKNQERDKANVEKLEKLGWRVITIWACEISQDGLVANLLSKLSPAPK